MLTACSSVGSGCSDDEHSKCEEGAELGFFPSYMSGLLPGSREPGEIGTKTFKLPSLLLRRFRAPSGCFSLQLFLSAEAVHRGWSCPAGEGRCLAEDMVCLSGGEAV